MSLAHWLKSSLLMGKPLGAFQLHSLEVSQMDLILSFNIKSFKCVAPTYTARACVATVESVSVAGCFVALNRNLFIEMPTLIRVLDSLRYGGCTVVLEHIASSYGVGPANIHFAVKVFCCLLACKCDTGCKRSCLTVRSILLTWRISWVNSGFLDAAWTIPTR